MGSPTDLLLVLCLPHIKGELSGLELEAPPSATHTGDLCGPTESAATVVTVVVRGGGVKTAVHAMHVMSGHEGRTSANGTTAIRSYFSASRNPA